MISLRKGLRTLAVAFLSLIVIVSSVVNRGDLTFSLFPLPYEITMPTFLFLLACLALGALIGGAVVGVKKARLASLLKRQENRLAALESEISALRAEAAQHLPEVPRIPHLT